MLLKGNFTDSAMGYSAGTVCGRGDVLWADVSNLRKGTDSSSVFLGCFYLYLGISSVSLKSNNFVFNLLI